MTTCTIPTATGGLCGAPAVHILPGGKYAECAAHVLPGTVLAAPAPAVTAATLGIRTRTTRPYVLVVGKTVVGYAEAKTPAVVKRAARLGARIIPVR